MNSCSIESLQQQYRNIVVQIKCEYKTPDLTQPFRTSLLQNRRGSGFFVNVSRFLLITNAHVVANASSIRCSHPSIEDDIRLSLLSLCLDLDIALCEVIPSDRQFFEKQNLIQPIFGDSMTLIETSSVIAIGYPLGEEGIKFTVGNVSGFPRDDNLQHFVQITTPTNPGNSGGPIIDNNCHIVGILTAMSANAQNTNYMLTIRTLYAIFGGYFCRNEKLNSIIWFPMFACCWCPINEDLRTLHSVPENGGIYISNVDSKSCFFNHLCQGDILMSIEYEDINYNHHVKATFNNKGHIYFDFSNRIGTMGELQSIIPLNSNVITEIYRNGEPKIFEVKWVMKEKISFDVQLTSFHPLEYKIIAGICFCSAMKQHVIVFPELNGHVGGASSVLISYIFPETHSARDKVCNSGSRVSKINGKEIKKISDILDVLSTSKYLQIELMNSKYYVLKLSNARNDDSEIQRKYELNISLFPLLTSKKSLRNVVKT